MNWFVQSNTVFWHYALSTDLIMLKYVLLLLFVTTLATAQEKNKISLDKFPDLHKNWTADDYQAVLSELKAAQAKGLRLPTLDDSYYHDFFKRLVSYDNLSAFSDSTRTPKERINIAVPYTAIIPDFINLYTDGHYDNEGVVIGLFTMEATVRLMRTVEEAMKCVADSKREAFYTSQRNERSMYMVIGGGLDILAAGPDGGTIDMKYLLPVANWCLQNTLPSLDWMTPADQLLCRQKAEAIAKNKYSKEIKAIGQKLLQAIVAYKPAPRTTFQMVILANEVLPDRLKNPALGIEIEIPPTWATVPQQRLATFKSKQDSVAKKMNLPIGSEQENTAKLLSVQKEINLNGFSPVLLVNLENIECFNVKASSKYLQQVRSLLVQSNVGYTFQEIETVTINGQEFAILKAQLKNVKQEYAATIVKGKFALSYTATYMDDKDGEELRQFRVNTRFNIQEK